MATTMGMAVRIYVPWTGEALRNHQLPRSSWQVNQQSLPLDDRLPYLSPASSTDKLNIMPAGKGLMFLGPHSVFMEQAMVDGFEAKKQEINNRHSSFSYLNARFAR